LKIRQLLERGGLRRRSPGGEIQAGEDRRRDVGRVDHGEDPDRAAAARALEDIDREDAAQELWPGKPPRAKQRRLSPVVLEHSARLCAAAECGRRRYHGARRREKRRGRHLRGETIVPVRIADRRGRGRGGLRCPRRRPPARPDRVRWRRARRRRGSGRGGSAGAEPRKRAFPRTPRVIGRRDPARKPRLNRLSADVAKKRS
jgi:hypothetical protein